ncbi:hypothetical protein [Mesorhizobium mediterraneum]|uniref:hypothetical protein n=1 Tax=Mesorhizobium mediterraneum TaxID=43617 RepID=UPI0017806477|nr:hypothetical protein [Mesorhizobium mediterraneum]
MVLSQLLDPNELIRVGAKAGGIQYLEATVVHELLTNAQINKELESAVSRKSKMIK